MFLRQTLACTRRPREVGAILVYSVLRALCEVCNQVGPTHDVAVSSSVHLLLHTPAVRPCLCLAFSTRSTKRRPPKFGSWGTVGGANGGAMRLMSHLRAQVAGRWPGWGGCSAPLGATCSVGEVCLLK